MSKSLVVVAIPEEQDRVWKFSSEKVPHLTLLFLGDAEHNPKVQEIMQFVQHATLLSEHGPFYMDVDRRGTLGEDDADVIFFNKRAWNLKWLKHFRHQLLQNDTVRAAYDSVEQFPEWTPHLTLGYPETPAKIPEGDHPLYSVAFDRIAVWTGDYEGPDTKLEWPDRELDGDLAMAWADQQKSALMHYGVKGMKWGVRQSLQQEPKKGRWDPSGHDLGSDLVKTFLWPLVPPLGLFSIPANVRLARGGVRALDKKAVQINEQRFEKRAQSAKNFVEINNRAAPRINREIDGINKKYPQDLTKDKAAAKKYDAEVTKSLQTAYRDAANSIGNSPRTKHLDVSFKNDGLDFVIKAKDGAAKPMPKRIAHAAGDEIEMVMETVELTFTGKLKRVATGHIVGMEFDDMNEAVIEQSDTDDELTQTADSGEEFVLEHVGVKGMKWGVRKQPVRSGLRKAGEVVGDAYFRSEANSTNNISKLVGQASTQTKNRDLPAINKKYKALGAKTSGNVKLIGTSNVPIQKQYREEVRAAYAKRLDQVANEQSSRSSNLRYEITGTAWTGKQSATKWRVKTVKVKHADGDEIEFDVIPVFDEDGYIVDFKTEKVETKLTQAALGEEFIMHYGVKGMKWGVRNRKGTPVAVDPTATSKVPYGDKRKTKIKTEGGQNQDASPDAIKVAQAKAKLKKSGTASLSNQELREVADRLRLEQQVKELAAPKGKRFVKGLISDEGKNAARSVVREGVRDTTGIGKKKQQ